MALKSLRPRSGLKFLLSLGLILGSTIYALTQNSVSPSNVAVAVPAPAKKPSAVVAVVSAPKPVVTQPTPTPATPPAGPVQTPTPTPIQTPLPPPKPKGQYQDGSYTGSVADAYYGLVQVQAVVSGGKLTDVRFLQYPSDRSTSRYINGQAMPLLIQEAIQVQSAQVDGVSGASDTSAAFMQSLGSALAQAKT